MIHNFTKEESKKVLDGLEKIKCENCNLENECDCYIGYKGSCVAYWYKFVGKISSETMPENAEATWDDAWEEREAREDICREARKIFDKVVDGLIDQIKLGSLDLTEAQFKTFKELVVEE